MLSSDILARFLGATETHELWGKIVSYFQKQLRAKARQLRVYELRRWKIAPFKNTFYEFVF
jgi:hypothetical protein